MRGYKGGLLLVAVCLLTPLSARGASADDQAAADRGRKAIAWMQGFACPKPGKPLQISGLAGAADTQRIRYEHWTFVSSLAQKHADAVAAYRLVQAEIQASGGKPSKKMRKSFEELEGSLEVTGLRAANALVQWSLATWVEMSRVTADYDMLSNAPDPVAPFAEDAVALQQLAAPFGTVLEPVTAKFQSCLASFNDTFLDYSTPQIMARAGQAKTSAQLEPLLAVIGRHPVDPTLPGAQTLLQVQARRDQFAREEQQKAELERAKADKEARARLAADAQRVRVLAERYVAAINSGRVEDAIALLDDQVQLSSPQGNAQGKAALAQRMREAQSKNDGSTRTLPPEIDADFQVVSRVQSARGSGKITFQAANGKLTRLAFSQ